MGPNFRSVSSCCLSFARNATANPRALIVRFRTLRGEVLVPKIIVLSGQLGQTEMLTAARFMGADLVLPKPVAIDALLMAVKTVAAPSEP